MLQISSTKNWTYKFGQEEPDPIEMAIRSVIQEDAQQQINEISNQYPESAPEVAETLNRLPSQKIIDAVYAILYSEELINVPEDQFFLNDGSVNMDVIRQAYQILKSYSKSPGPPQNLN